MRGQKVTSWIVIKSTEITNTHINIKNGTAGTLEEDYIQLTKDTEFKTFMRLERRKEKDRKDEREKDKTGANA